MNPRLCYLQAGTFSWSRMNWNWDQRSHLTSQSVSEPLTISSSILEPSSSLGPGGRLPLYIKGGLKTFLLNKAFNSGVSSTISQFCCCRFRLLGGLPWCTSIFTQPLWSQFQMVLDHFSASTLSVFCSLSVLLLQVLPWWWWFLLQLLLLFFSFTPQDDCSLHRWQLLLFIVKTWWKPSDPFSLVPEGPAGSQFSWSLWVEFHVLPVSGWVSSHSPKTCCLGSAVTRNPAEVSCTLTIV